MRIPSLRQQIFGNINKQLNQIRAQMNRKIREECLEVLAKKREKMRYSSEVRKNEAHN